MLGLYEELISKTSYIHCYMLLIYSSSHSKKQKKKTKKKNKKKTKTIFNIKFTSNGNVDTNWNLE